MKAVILAGGYGTRMSEATSLIPKPMVEIGGKPILWHIMQIYSHYGVNEFIICGGYKQYVIKEYFSNYLYHNSDLRIDLGNGQIDVLNNEIPDWKITIVDTGVNTMTGGRIKRIQEYVGDEPFFLTYGDGVSDVDISQSYDMHVQSGRVLSMMAFQPSGKLGVLDISDDGIVNAFKEKPDSDGTWINAGFFICKPELFDYLDLNSGMFEFETMQRLIEDGQLNAYKHNGSWMPMDTLNDNRILNELWEDGKAWWKKW